MDKSKKNVLIGLSIILLIGLVLIGFFLTKMYNRGIALNSRPLVLILEPDYGDQVRVGDGVLVHATAREDVGLNRIELWVNDQLIDFLDADISQEPAPTNLTLVSDWTPSFEGEQQIIVRAISADDISGQSMVKVSVAAADELTHLVSEGETLDSIAEEYGTTPDELSELNPELGGGGPAPGDEIFIPDDEPGSDAPGLPDDGGAEPPEPEGDTPFSGLVFPLFHFFTPDPGDVTLRLEVPGLRTWESFDSMHCYVSLADSLPQWYPDLDNDQATDESFEAGSDGWWITEGILVGGSAPIISWPADQPLPLSVACVGVSGGTEALEMGVIALEIPPDEWDGIRNGYESDGEGGHLLMDIQVTQLTGDPRNTPKYPDPDMSKPTNVRLNEEDHTLEWDFEAAEGEEIDGFRIYLNGNLQWTEDETARSSRLPPEWFNPPCAWTYTFGVTAYQIDFPDGPESDPPSEVDLTQPREGCMRIMRVTFLELETFNLGGDGRYERRHGDVGPAYGSFYANDARVSFDHGHEGRGLDMAEGLSHNTTYDLAVVSGDEGWHFADYTNSIVTEVPYEGELFIGFIIMDRDNNPDDQICEGFHYPIRDAWGQLDGYHRESMTSENGRCRVTFEYEPTPDSPVGERYLGAEPLPWLEVVALDVYSNPDETIVAVENSGTASWPGRTLTLELQTRDGHSLGHVVFDDVTIPIGGVETFRIPRTTPGPLIDVCVMVDSLDEVLELYERSGALIHHPYCTNLPDVIVRDVVYTDSDGMLRIFIQNIGDGPIANWPLDINISLANGENLFDRYRVTELSLPAGRSYTVVIPLLGDDRARMFDGYSVTLNPDQGFPESSYDNNSTTIPGGAEISMSLFMVEAPEGLRDIVEFHVDAYILQGHDRKEHLVNWDVTQEIDWNNCFGDDTCFKHFNDAVARHDFYTLNNPVFGDESLELVIEITHPGSLWSDFSVTEVYDSPGWEAGEPSPSAGSGGGCYFWPRRDDVGRHGFYFSNGSGSNWYTRVDICRNNYGE